MNSASKENQVVAYDLFIAALAIAAVVLITFRMTLQDTSETAHLLDMIDYGICAIFFCDFLRSLIRAENKWRYLYTWGWFDLLSSLPAISTFRYFRLARILRILRVVRSLKILVGVTRRDRPAALLSLILFIGMMSFIVICVGVLHFEHDAPGATIKTADDVLWWAVVTCSTVGYGDEYPVTQSGRVLAGLLMVIGIGAFATATTALGVFFKRIQPTLVSSKKSPEQHSLESISLRLSRIESLLTKESDDSEAT